MYVVSEWFGLTSVYSTTRRTEYSSDNLRECLNAVQNKTMSLREASRHFGIPRSTIQKRLKSSEPEKIKSLGRYKRAFSDNMEIHMQGASVAPVATFAPYVGQVWPPASFYKNDFLSEREQNFFKTLFRAEAQIVVLF